MRQCITSDEATPRATQHKKPCSDCPWSRRALKGWLGGDTPEQWLQVAFGEVKEPCHVHPNQQCAGLAIFRKNICKAPRDGTILVLPKNTTLVFSTPAEFLAHHTQKKD